MLEMRLEGYTQEEIADELGYKNHSGVQKRITKWLFKFCPLEHSPM